MIGLLAPIGAASATPTERTVENECFIRGAYQAFLGRDATDTEQADWVAELAGGAPRTALAEDLANSDEWLGVMVTDLYQQALDRDPDANGRAHWIGQLRGGAMVNQVATLIYGSGEYYNRVGGTPEGFVNSLYQRILVRPADAAGRNYWIGQIEARGRGGVAAEFFASRESRTDRVWMLFQRLLGRTPDAAGRQYWVEQLLTVNDVRLAVHLASSSEFFNRSQQTCGDPIEVATEALPEATVGVAYQATLEAIGGTGEYTWEADGLPEGLSLSGDQISGTPTTAGEATVTVTVTDGFQTVDRTLGLTVQDVPAEVRIFMTSLPPASTNQPYEADLVAFGGTGDYTWDAEGLLPGLAVDGDQITGTPTGGGNVEVTLTVDDGETTDSVVLVLDGRLAPEVQIDPFGSIPANQLVSREISGRFGTPPYTFSATGLPPGVTMGAASWHDGPHGYPQAAGLYNMTFTVTDALGRTGTLTRSWRIHPELIILNDSLPRATVGEPYAVTLEATGGTGTYSWSALPVQSGGPTLPPGFSISGDQLVGTPTAGGVGTHQVRIRVMSGGGNGITKILPLVIER